MQLYVNMNDWFCMFHDDLSPCYPLLCLFCVCVTIYDYLSLGLFKAALLRKSIKFHTLGSDIVLFMVPDDLWVRSFMTDYYTCISISATLG